MVKRNSYLYNAKNSLPYPVWNITITYHANTISYCVPWDCGLKRQIPIMRSNKPSHKGSMIGSNIICNNSYPTIEVSNGLCRVDTTQCLLGQRAQTNTTHLKIVLSRVDPCKPNKWPDTTHKPRRLILPCHVVLCRGPWPMGHSLY